MVLEKLGSMLIETIDKIKRAMVVDKKTVEMVVRDLQRALLLADVDVTLVMKISESVRRKALEEELPPGISRRQHLIKVIYDELINLLGGRTTYSIVYKDKPHIIMLVGIQGSGKTTTLYSILNTLNTVEKKIITIEDPVEYNLAGIQQVNINEDISLDYALALKNTLIIFIKK